MQKYNGELISRGMIAPLRVSTETVLKTWKERSLRVYLDGLGLCG